MTYGTFQFRTDYRKELVPWLNCLNPDTFITLNFNRETSHNGARKSLGQLLARLDRKLLGSRWMKYPDKRTDIIAFPENILTNFHLHCLGTLPPKAYDMCQVTLTDWIAQEWKSVVSSGSVHFDFIRYDKNKPADYSTKQIMRSGGIESFIFSREFWSQG